jgi:hypothetical protein
MVTEERKLKSAALFALWDGGMHTLLIPNVHAVEATFDIEIGHVTART